jgi:hypothetical protein
LIKNFKAGAELAEALKIQDFIDGSSLLGILFAIQNFLQPHYKKVGNKPIPPFPKAGSGGILALSYQCSRKKMQVPDFRGYK